MLWKGFQRPKRIEIDLADGETLEFLGRPQALAMLRALQPPQFRATVH